MMEPAAATPRTTLFAFLVLSVYICIGIVTGNSERVDNPLKLFLIRAPSKSRSLGGFLFYPFYELFIESPSGGCVAGAFMQNLEFWREIGIFKVSLTWQNRPCRHFWGAFGT